MVRHPGRRLTRHALLGALLAALLSCASANGALAQQAAPAPCGAAVRGATWTAGFDAIYTRETR